MPTQRRDNTSNPVTVIDVKRDKSLNDAGGPNIGTRDDWLDQMNQRLTHVQHYCENHRVSVSGQRRGEFYLYEPARVAYCSVPKNGCTFWKRVIRFLNKDFPPGNVDIFKPSDMSRHFVHFGPFKTTRRTKYYQKGVSILQKMVNSFMFARDPYSRLWSAYLDKIVLPDFWKMGQNIIRAERSQANNLSLKCGHDVSFPEFIHYVVQRPNIDFHFAPVHTTCDPCQLNFKFIGKQETFVQDAKHIINETGMISGVGMEIFNETAIDEMKSLSEDYLNLGSYKLRGVCNNKTLICQRLWKVFQINGYIGFEIDFPSELYDITDSKKLEKEFIAKAIETYRNGASFRDKLKRQRRESLVNAFRSLSNETLNDFKAMYKTDFEMFNYDEEPADIYKSFIDY